MLRSDELDVQAILAALAELGHEHENVSWGNTNDDITILLKGYRDHDELAHRFVSIRMRGSKLKLSNCQFEIDLCHPDSLEILDKAIRFHKTLPQNYSCASCPLQEPYYCTTGVSLL
jgi:hypothetical protein